ncbi:MAG TPA: 50S ribosomal protein L2 [Candidatus Acidoferrales bacterium]|nr:50S ribosomal protein L2 [Candidatus Acidoferrales bacterium]
MGKQIRVQRRGRGGSNFRAHTFRRIAPAKFPIISPTFPSLKGVVREIMHEPARGAPLALIELTNGTSCCLPATEGLFQNQSIVIGRDASPDVGNVLHLGRVPEGTLVSTVELHPGDGGRIAKSSGTYCLVVAHTPQGTELRMPSGKSVYMNDQCRAVVGVVAGAGRIEKPFLKAGTVGKLMRARGRVWHKTKGQKMIAASHPHGGGRHKHSGKPTTVGRNTPPGRKVGMIAARQTGRAKRAVRT